MRLAALSAAFNFGRRASVSPLALSISTKPKAASAAYSPCAMYAPNIANSAPIDITPSDIWTFLRQDRLQRPRVPVSFSLVESATRNSSRVLWIVETL
jgi:hypothetical protein